jgi:hypothetical protein
MNNNNNASRGGLGLASVLTIVFVVLKLVGVIDWSWWWVLAPLWIDLILTVLVIVGVAIYLAHDEKKYENEYGTSRKRKKNKWKF